MNKTEEINIKIELDSNRIPEMMSWKASENQKESQIKAMMLSVWDKAESNTMRIDLWNKEMSVDEMKQFIHQSLLTMSDSFERATGDKIMAETMRDFCSYFAEKMNLRAPI
jgi:gliding motility-associated protein GldC